MTPCWRGSARICSIDMVSGIRPFSLNAQLAKKRVKRLTSSFTMDKNDSIYVAGHRGWGSAVVRRLQRAGFKKLLTRSRSELNLLERSAVRAFFEQERPAIVVDAAAKVGGIAANNEQPVEFLLQNVAIQNNMIEAAADFGTGKLLFLGSSCIYPKFAPQPIPESALLTGVLEPTNEAYALAKIAGIKLCQAYAREYPERSSSRACRRIFTDPTTISISTVLTSFPP